MRVLVWKAQKKDSDRSKDGKETDDDEGKIDKGPSILSINQSAITGESLVVYKCNFLFLFLSDG